MHTCLWTQTMKIENTDMVMINKSHFMKAQKTKSIYSPITLLIDRNVQTFPDIFLAFMVGLEVCAFAWILPTFSSGVKYNT
jgi:hypothetical protein